MTDFRSPGRRRLAASRLAIAACCLAATCAAAFAEPADGPAPPPAVEQPAPQEKPGAEKPRAMEYLGNDLIRRPDGMIVRYYRVNYVSPLNLVNELKIWQSAKAVIEPSGAQFVAAPVATPAPGTAAKTAGISTANAPISNTLRIVETEENWPVLERILSMVDIPQPQVRIETRIVELTSDDQLKVGVSAKFTRTLGDTFLQSTEATFPNALDAVNGTTTKFRRSDKFLVFDYAMQLVAQGAMAEVQSQPQVLVGQGETAILRAGDDEPYVTQSLQGNQVTLNTTFKPVGIKLEVQPLLIGRDAVRVRIVAEASRVSDFRVTATSQDQQVVNAVISTRNADTVVTVPDGETLVIGGLEQTTKRDTKTGLPLLKDIPGLGYLFGSTTTRNTRSTLWFLITLTIETPEEARLIVPPGERDRGRPDADKRSSDD